MAENTATRNVQQQQQQQQQHPVVPRRHHHHPGVPVGTQTAQAIITGNGTTSSSVSSTTTSSSTTTATNGPRTVVLQRQNNDFGFTLRHFIVYPPESCTKSAGGANYLTQPMDSIFVKEVHPGTSAHFAGLLEGDRLLAVNGVPVVGTSYPHVVAMIQQTPKTLTLQVVPKNYDLIQAYFGDTAHNPETNRRQQIYGVTAPRQASFDSLSERQESLYGTLQSLVQPMGNNIYSEPQAIYSRPKMKEAKATIGNVIIRAKDPTYDAIKMQQRRESGSSIASSVLSYDSKSTVTNTSDNSMGDSAIISRIRKSCEQKEEFLRRPSQPFVYNVAAASQQNNYHPQLQQQQQVSPQRHPVIFENVAVPSGQHPQHREFYSRPNRLQKAMWPPHEQLSISPTPGQTATSPPTSPPQQKQTQHMSMREQFFNSLQREPSPKLAVEAEPEMRKELPHQNLRVVSELTKQFSSGRPLSPDGIMDRTLLYKSELSRLQQKQVHPNVALRRREFELKAETADWRRSLDKNRSSSVDTESTEHPEGRARSLSAESSHTSTTTTTTTTDRRDEAPPVPPPRNKHSNESHISAVRSTNDTGVVKLRQKVSNNNNSNNDVDADDDKPMRRVSYLRATAADGGGCFHIDSDFDSSPVSLVPELELETPETDEPPLNVKPHTTKDKALSHFRDSPADSSVPVTHDGVLRIKITVIDGKRSHDRSWRTVHAELRGYRFKLTIIRDGKASQSPEPSGIIDLTNFHLTEGNYTKRKHVFKLTTSQPVCPPGSPSITSFKPHERELLIQADNEHDMKVWMNVLRNVCRTNSAATIGANEYITNNNLGQVAEPQTMPAVQQVQQDEFSPVLSNKTQRKYAFDSRSPSGQSPVTKSRKTPMTPNAASGNSRDGSDKETGSPKSKTWKGIVARQFRRIGGGPGGQPQEILPPEGASFGVPLSLCPPSLENEYVPMLVARCVDIVEAKGLNVVGIYRVPGNTAAITQLTEQVNRGFDETTLKDPRWEDVNVVSSLLKSFIRNLPEPILPNDFYHRFIAADKLAGTKRLEKLKAVLQEFPPYSYETLKLIIRHLHRVSHNSVVNLMDPRNLAIVFGPSVVRCTTGTLESDVKDMKHQCQIVEALVTHFSYFFENESLPDVTDGNHGPATETSLEVQSKNLLLDNVAKLEHSKEHSSRFVANIVQAANRKIRRTAQRKSNVSSAVSSADTLSLDSTTSAESKGQRKLSYLSDSSGHGLNKDNQGHTMLSTEVMPSSEDDSNDSAFNENVGSMSLTGVTIVLDNKLKSLRDTKIELANREKFSEETKENINTTKSHRPLTLGGENIPYADESPERPLIQPRTTKALRPHPFINNTEVVSIPKSDESKEISSSDDTDTSTTSNPRDVTNLSASTIRIEQLREMSRMLSNLEKKAHHLERKFCLNRSLSLNYKNQNNKNAECCCRTAYYNSSNNNNNNVRSRLSLTKDEKTDKNISKRRQLQDSSNKRRGAKDRSIRRRHTVGGAHDYYNKAGHTVNDCDRYIVTDISSNTLKLEDEDDGGASDDDDDNEYSRK